MAWGAQGVASVSSRCGVDPTKMETSYHGVFHKDVGSKIDGSCDEQFFFCVLRNSSSF